ncbi:facilitated trehalose transporter Tret1-like [Phlebotomus argentipes]|uniref:facilitated trehalose transporter Tret1-like n=1 Tax=Phlebotomus argentipes TaxID=94469 RepID=UPI0028935639|nr:facilitated trehalose transporter Tret1-like [Phlebotomus argentipes]
MNHLSKAIVRQTILSLCVSLGYFGIGLVRGFSAPAIPSIKETFPQLLPERHIETWVSSVPPLGAFFGSLVTMVLMHRMGRKISVLLAAPIWAVSWALIALSQRWEIIMAGRTLSGLAVGITLPSAQIYVSECSDPKIRGVLASFPAIAMSLGIVFAYVIGSFLPWRQQAWFACAVGILQFIVIAFLPESPVWLKSKKRIPEADVSAEWLALSGFSTAADQASAVKAYKSYSLRALCRRTVLLPLAVGLVLLMIQQLSGIDAVIFFTVEIFRASGSSINGNIATIIVGVVQLLSNFASLFVVDRFGRKPLLIVSGALMSISMTSMGFAFHLSDNGNNEYGFLPLVSLIVFMIGFSVGFGCIPFLLMGEIFPTKQRSILSSFAGSFNLLIMFIVIFTYHPLQVAISTAGTFWAYAVMCLLGVLFVISYVPETKGRDLESITQLFERKSCSRKVSAVKSAGVDNLAMTASDANLEAPVSKT